MKFLEALGFIFLGMVLLVVMPVLAIATVKILEIMIGIFVGLLALIIPLTLLSIPFVLSYLFIRWTIRAIRN